MGLRQVAMITATTTETNHLVITEISPTTMHSKVEVSPEKSLNKTRNTLFKLTILKKTIIGKNAN